MSLRVLKQFFIVPSSLSFTFMMKPSGKKKFLKFVIYRYRKSRDFCAVVPNMPDTSAYRNCHLDMGDYPNPSFAVLGHPKRVETETDSCCDLARGRKYRKVIKS